MNKEPGMQGQTDHTISPLSAPEPIAPLPVQAQPEPHQWTLDTIGGAIAYGRMGANPPPSPDHWLNEYWQIGRQLAKLGETSAWDNVTPADADPAAQVQAQLVAGDEPNFLLSTMDAKIWADEFVKRNSAADHGTMLGWFACAIMTGFDEANRRLAATQPAAASESVDAGVVEPLMLNYSMAISTGAKVRAVQDMVDLFNTLAANKPAAPAAEQVAQPAPKVPSDDWRIDAVEAELDENSECDSSKRSFARQIVDRIAGWLVEGGYPDCVCPNCDGSGKVEVGVAASAAQPVAEPVCKACDDEGMVWVEGCTTPCLACQDVTGDSAAPAAPAVQPTTKNPYTDNYRASYWQAGFDGTDIDPTTRGHALAAYSEGLCARPSVVSPVAAAVPEDTERLNLIAEVIREMGYICIHDNKPMTPFGLSVQGCGLRAAIDGLASRRAAAPTTKEG